MPPIWFHFGTDFGTLHYSIQVALSTSDTPQTAEAILSLNIEKIPEYAEILKKSYWAQHSSMSAVLEEANRVGTR